MIDKENIGGRCEEYKNLKNQWELWIDSTRGPGFVRAKGEKYLFKNEKEEDDEYNKRAKGTEYVDFGARIVNFYHSRITGPGFQVSLFPEGTEDTPPEWEAFLNNCNRSGMSYERWIKAQLRWAIGVGTMGVLIDLPSTEQAPANQYEERQRGDFPYLVRIWPWQIINYTVEDGVMTEVAILEETLQEGDKEEDRKEIILYYDRNGWERYEADKDGKRIGTRGSGEHGLGEIPLVLFHSDDIIENEFYSHPVAENAHISALVLYNHISRLEQLSVDQGFALGYYYGDGDEPLDIGPRRLMAIPPEGGGAPGFVSPGSDLLQVGLDFLNQRVEWLDLMTHQGVSSATNKGIVEQSGLSKLMDQEDPTHFLRELGSRFRNPINETQRLIWKRSGDESKNQNDFVVQFPDRFALKDGTTVVRETTEKLDLFAQSPTARKVLLQSAAEEVLGRMATSEQMAEILKELENLEELPNRDEEIDQNKPTGL